VQNKKKFLIVIRREEEAPCGLLLNNMASKWVRERYTFLLQRLASAKKMQMTSLNLNKEKDSNRVLESSGEAIQQFCANESFILFSTSHVLSQSPK
jgi:hypothetical protein